MLFEFVSRLEVPFHFRARSQIGELEVGLDRDPTQPPLVLPGRRTSPAGSRTTPFASGRRLLSMVEWYASEGRWRGLLEPLEYIVRKRKVFTEANEARAITQAKPAMDSQSDAGADPQQSDRPERGQDR